MTILHLILLLTHPSESYQIDLRESQKSMTPILESTSKPHLFLIGKANNRADEFQVVSDYYNTSIQADYATIKFDEGRPYSLRLNYSGASSDLLEASSRRIAEDLSLDSSKLDTWLKTAAALREEGAVRLQGFNDAKVFCSPDPSPTALVSGAELNIETESTGKLTRLSVSFWQRPDTEMYCKKESISRSKYRQPPSEPVQRPS